MSKQRRKQGGFYVRKPSIAFIASMRVVLLMAQKKRCYYCGDKLTHSQATTDHVIPQKLGGTWHKDNCVAACGKCNKVKGDKLVEHFWTEYV